jgi:uncharacterized repeat protein (TIGR01451 family)
MTFLSWLRRKSLLLTISSLSVVAYGVIPTVAQTGQTVINNTASGGADNLPDEERVDSNQVTVQASQAALQLTKTGDRAAAEPGDTVIYTLRVKNQDNAQATAENISIEDTLPRGLRLAARSNQLEGSIDGETVQLTINNDRESRENRRIEISSEVDLAPGQTLIVNYPVEVTPDAIRGSGINSAIARAGELTSDVSRHRLRIRQGILSDCGTLIGRVFVDKNFDGEQQPNEPGVPNAVIYMDDGNRIVTDANGLYSLANVISGYRSAALDMTSLPGYSLAPNKYFIETNSPSRLVKLAPGSMVRVNFGVTPAFSEGKNE